MGERNRKRNLSKVDKQKLDLWTAHEMSFMVDGTIRIIPRFTPCTKPVYTRKIRDYLDKMEQESHTRPEGNPKGVAIKLKGMIRYVWRTDVLTKEEYDAAREKQRAAIGALGKKPGRPVGESTEA